MLEILNLLKLNFKTSIKMMILMTMLVLLNLLKLNFFLALCNHLDKTTMILMKMLVLLNLLKLNFFFSFMQSFGQDDHDIDEDVGVIEFA